MFYLLTVILLEYHSYTAEAECDRAFCCCPTGPVRVSKNSNRVSLRYNVGCPWTGIYSNYHCVIQQDSICRIAFPGFIYAISKSRDTMDIEDVRDHRCNLHLRCSSGTCRGNDNWAGRYLVEATTSNNNATKTKHACSRGLGAYMRSTYHPLLVIVAIAAALYNYRVAY